MQTGIGCFGFRIGLAGSSGITYITDPVIIAMITNEASWNDDGNYTGLYTGLNPGDIYFDINTGLRYEFDGSNLIRGNFNEAI